MNVRELIDVLGAGDLDAEVWLDVGGSLGRLLTIEDPLPPGGDLPPMQAVVLGGQDLAPKDRRSARRIREGLRVRPCETPMTRAGAALQGAGHGGRR